MRKSFETRIEWNQVESLRFARSFAIATAVTLLLQPLTMTASATEPPASKTSLRFGNFFSSRHNPSHASKVLIVANDETSQDAPAKADSKKDKQKDSDKKDSKAEAKKVAAEKKSEDKAKKEATKTSEKIAKDAAEQAKKDKEQAKAKADAAEKAAKKIEPKKVDEKAAAKAKSTADDAKLKEAKKKKGWFNKPKDDDEIIVVEEEVIEGAPDAKKSIELKTTSGPAVKAIPVTGTQIIKPVAGAKPAAVINVAPVTPLTTTEVVVSDKPVLLPDNALVSVLQDISKSLGDAGETQGVQTADEKIIVSLARQLLDQSLGTGELKDNRILAPEHNNTAKNSMTTEAWASGDVIISDKLRGSVATVWGKRINGMLHVTIAGECQNKTLSNGEKVGEFIVVVKGRSPVKTGFDIQSQADVTYWIGALDAVSIDAACCRLKEKAAEGESESASPSKSVDVKGEVKKKSTIVLDTILTQRGLEYLRQLALYQEQLRLLAQQQAEAALVEHAVATTVDTGSGLGGDEVKSANRKSDDDDDDSDRIASHRANDDDDNKVAESKRSAADKASDASRKLASKNDSDDNDNRDDDDDNDRRNKKDNVVEVKPASDKNASLKVSKNSEASQKDLSTNAKSNDNNTPTIVAQPSNDKGWVVQKNNEQAASTNSDSPPKDLVPENGGESTYDKPSDKPVPSNTEPNNNGKGGETSSVSIDTNSNNNNNNNNNNNSGKLANSASNAEKNPTKKIVEKNSKSKDDRKGFKNAKKDDHINPDSPNTILVSPSSLNAGQTSASVTQSPEVSVTSTSNTNANSANITSTSGSTTIATDSAAKIDPAWKDDWSRDGGGGDAVKLTTSQASAYPNTTTSKVDTSGVPANAPSSTRIAMATPAPASASSRAWESPALNLAPRSPSLGAALLIPERAIAGQFLTVSVIAKDKQPERSVELSFNGATVSTDMQGQALYMIPEDMPPGETLHISLAERPEVSSRVVDILQTLDDGGTQKTPRIDKVSPFVANDGVLVIDGHDFDGLADKNRIVIDSTVETKVIASSPVQLRLLIPGKLQPGTHTVTINGTTLRSAPAKFDFIKVEVEQPDAKKAKSAMDRIIVRIRGTRQPVAVRVVNRSPDVIKVSKGDNILITTPGGNDNSSALGFKQLKKGDYKIEASIEI